MRERFWYREGPAGLELFIRVKPNARRSALLEISEDKTEIIVAIAAPAVEGAANRTLCAYLSEFLEVRKSRICLLRGEHSTQKHLCIDLDKNEVAETIEKIKNGCTKQ